MLQQKCSEFRIDYPYLQKDNLLNSSRDLLVAFGSLKKRMKKEKNEKGKKRRERHTTRERKKWERDKEEGRQREKDKEKDTWEEKRERKRKIKFHCSHLVQEDASRKKIPLAERGSGAGTKIVATPNINHFVEIWFWAILTTLKRGSHPLFLKQSALSQNPLMGGFWNLAFLRWRVAKKVLP